MKTSNYASHCAVCLLALFLAMPASLIAGGSQRADNLSTETSTYFDLTSNATLHQLPFELAGRWQVVWGQLVDPGDFGQHYIGDYFELPQRWNQLEHPALDGPYGVATFRAQIALPEAQKNLSLHLISPHSAWRLYANETLLGENGQPSSKRESFAANYVSRVFTLPPKTTELVLQVANFSHAYGGPGHPITVWNSEELDQTLRALTVYYTAALGILLAIGLFHSIIYLADRHHREQGSSHLWFGLLCFVMVVRIANVVPHFHLLYPDAAYWSTLMLSYATLAIAPGIYLLFFRAIFTEYFPKHGTWLLIISSFLLAVIALLLPEHIYTKTRNIAILLNIMSIIYSIVCTLRALLAKQRGATAVLVANALFFGTALSDALLYTDQSYGFDLTPFGFLLLGMGYSYALLQRLRATFEQARDTSYALEKLNLQLEAQVKERTHAFKAAAARAENVAKERIQFIAAASHDLRQPLHALSMFNAAIKRRNQDAKLEGIIDKQANSIQSLGNLLQDTLDTAQLEVGNQSPKASKFAVQEMLGNILNEFKIRLDQHAIQLKLDCEAGVLVTDYAMAQRIIRNLIDNAVKAASKQVTVVAMQNDGNWQFTIRDDGMGIANADIERIFEPYSTIEQNELAVGYGLGLYVVSEFTRALNGKVSVKSTLGEGSEFQVSLPSLTVNPTGTNRLDSRADTEKVKHQGVEVLAIDDDPQVIDALQSLLEEWGCQVSVAKDLQQAKCIGIKAPQLLLVDYHLLGQDGVEAIRQLREHFGKEIPAAVVTGATEAATLQRIKEHELPILTKPVKPVELARLITKLAPQ